jgi:hypothetical protein
LSSIWFSRLESVRGEVGDGPIISQIWAHDRIEFRARI